MEEQVVKKLKKLSEEKDEEIKQLEEKIKQLEEEVRKLKQAIKETKQLIFSPNCRDHFFYKHGSRFI